MPTIGESNESHIYSSLNCQPILKRRSFARVPLFLSLCRIGRSIAENVYAVAVIYVRFALLTLVIYLLAHWYFGEFAMVIRNREAALKVATEGHATTPPPNIESQSPSSHSELWLNCTKLKRTAVESLLLFIWTF